MVRVGMLIISAADWELSGVTEVAPLRRKIDRHAKSSTAMLATTQPTAPTCLLQQY